MKIEYPDTGITVWIGPIGPESTGRAGERVAAAALLREAFGRETALHHTPEGAPWVEEACKISISHCRGLAALAVGPQGKKIGIDIETLRPQLERVGPRVLSEEELEYYGRDLRSLTEAWTLKEAAYKAAGIGGLDFRRDIRLPLEEGNELYAGPHTLYIIERARKAGDALFSLVTN